MQKTRICVLSVIMSLLMLASTVVVLHVNAVSQWVGYVKPSYPDYAPSGMPDFDEKQDNWGPNQGMYTWCVPVAVADSLWWLDSKYESLYDSTPVAPPTISDHFKLVTSYNPGVWDDHDPQNVLGLVANLASLMNTDGVHTGGDHSGTRWVDVQPGIQAYLVQQGVDSSFEVHGMDFPVFPWIDAQVTKCQDVELFLEFWYFNGQAWQPITEPNFESGHCVACAGSNATTNQVLISDPYYDVSVPAANSAIHNDAQFVSHDPYNTLQYMFPPNPLPPPLYLAPPGYPPTALELQNYLLLTGWSGDPNWHTFVRGAVAVSPLPDVAVTNVTTSKTGCNPMETVGLGYNANVSATVLNLGSDPETFNVTTYANASLPSVIIIGNQSVSLLAGESKTLLFAWNTTGASYGNYTISAVADTVSGELNTTNNTYDYGKMLVTIPGDLDGDVRYDVNLPDLGRLAKAYNSHGPNYHYKGEPASPSWNPNSDINNDGIVNLSDLGIMAKHYNQHYP